jgi:hypothetical protein
VKVDVSLFIALQENVSVPYFDAENCHNFESLAGASIRSISSWQPKAFACNTLSL